MSEELRPCPFCGEQPEMQNMCGGYPGDEVYFCRCRIENHKEDLWSWQTRPLEDALQSRAERAEAMIERLIDAGNRVADNLDFVDGDTCRSSLDGGDALVAEWQKEGEE